MERQLQNSAAKSHNFISTSDTHQCYLRPRATVSSVPHIYLNPFLRPRPRHQQTFPKHSWSSTWAHKNLTSISAKKLRTARKNICIDQNGSDLFDDLLWEPCLGSINVPGQNKSLTGHTHRQAKRASDSLLVILDPSLEASNYHEWVYFILIIYSNVY